jgi:S1-C subfamily serine protease
MALLPPNFLKSVVSIEKKVKEDYKTIGTGFIYGKVLQKVEGQYSIRTYLVTAKHVLFKDGLALAKQKKIITLRFDSLGENVQLFDLPLYNKETGKAIFSCPLEDLDVAVIPLDGNALKKAGIDYVPILDSETALDSSKYEEFGLSNGDEIFYLGFPLGLRGEEKNYAMCRSGSIARVDSETVKNGVIYLDAPVFPGNSGGPVFKKPQLVSIEGTKLVNKAWLVGIATKFLSMGGERNTLNDEQIKKLEGHLGLSKIVIVDAIKKAIEESERSSTS